MTPALADPSVPSVRPDTPAPPEPASPGAAPRWLALTVGFGVLAACLLAGEWLKAAFGLILPGNILGLFILLALLASGVVPLHWVEAAARWLLFLLPLLFVPIFVVALKKAVHLPGGAAFFGAVFCGVLLLWAGVGHLAQRMLARPTPPAAPVLPSGPGREAGPE